FEQVKAADLMGESAGEHDLSGRIKHRTGNRGEEVAFWRPPPGAEDLLEALFGKPVDSRQSPGERGSESDLAQGVQRREGDRAEKATVACRVARPGDGRDRLLRGQEQARATRRGAESRKRHLSGIVKGGGRQ